MSVEMPELEGLDVEMAGRQRLMKVLHFPIYDNPYQALLIAATAKMGVVTVGSSEGDLLCQIREVARGDYDILHIHWIEAITRSKTLGRSVAKVAIFLGLLARVKLHRQKIVWTVHNLGNHEGEHARLEGWFARVLARIADRILVHGESAIAPVTKYLKIDPDKISVIYHGNYDTIVKCLPWKERSDGAGRRFLFFGAIRGYKGVFDLVDTFLQLPAAHELKIVGRPIDANTERSLRRTTENSPHIFLDIRLVSDIELEEYLSWCDFVVLPYRNIHTSGSLLMALTAGRIPIVPRLGTIGEYANDNCAILYDPSDPAGLKEALVRAAALDDGEVKRRSAKARQVADDFSWAASAERLVKVYREVLN